MTSERDKSLDSALFAVTLVSAAFVMTALAAPMFAGRTYLLNDLSWYHLPMRSLYSRCLAQGDSFTWTPDIYCGYYIHGDGQVGMLHPLHLLIYTILPLQAAFNLELILSYPVMLGGMYFFLRRWSLGRGPAFFGGMVFAFSGFNLLHLIHVNAIEVICHIPWLLFCIDLLFASSSRRSRGLASVAIAALTASQILLGYPQYVFYSCVTEVLYALLIFSRRTSNAAPVLFLLAKTAGVFLGAPQLLPTLSLAPGRYYQFMHSAGMPLAFSLDPHNLVQLIGPYLLSERVLRQNTHEFGVYDGAVVLLLVVWVVCNLRGLGRKRRLAIAAVLLTVLSLETAFGGYGKIYPAFLDFAPLRLLRAPCRFILLSHLGMSVAAAVSLDSIRKTVADGAVASWRKLLPVVAVPVMGVVITVLALHPAAVGSYLLRVLAREITDEPFYIVLGPTIACLAAVPVVAALRGWRPAILAVVILAAIDQGFYGISYLRGKPPETLERIEASVWCPPAGLGARVLTPGARDNMLVLDGYRLAHGYVGLPPHKYLDYSAPEVMRVAGIEWYVRKSDSETRWAKVDRPLPRARLVSRAFDSDTFAPNLADIDVDNIAFVPCAPALDGGPQGTASILTDSPGFLKIATSAVSKRLLIVSESYSEGWQAKVDGVPVAVLPAYEDFLGCVVEAGNHMVEFAFHAPGLALGTLLCGLGILLLAGVCCAICFLRSGAASQSGARSRSAEHGRVSRFRRWSRKQADKVIAWPVKLLVDHGRPDIAEKLLAGRSALYRWTLWVLIVAVAVRFLTSPVLVLMVALTSAPFNDPSETRRATS